MNKNIYWPKAFFWILGCFVLYLFLSFSSWHEPIMGDEVTYALSMKALNDKSITEFFINHGNTLFGRWYPPSYPYLIALPGRFFGVNQFTARAVNMSLFLISLILVYGIASELFKKSKKAREIAMLACIIYSLNPLAVRGSMLIDVDGTLLNVALLFVIYLLARDRLEVIPLKKIFIYAIALFMTFWAKTTTPTLLVGSLIMYRLLNRDRRKLLDVFKLVFLCSFIFCAAWFLYSRAGSRPFSDIFLVPWSVFKSYFIQGRSIKNWTMIARNIWTVFIWCSPSFVILGLLSLIKIFKEKTVDNSLMSRRQFAFYGVIVFLFYLVVGGVSHSFPKHHFAMMPVFSILISFLLVSDIHFDRDLIRRIGVVVVLLIIYNYYVIGDPLYMVNYALKENIIMSGGSSTPLFMTKAIIAFALLVLTIPIAYLFFAKEKIPKAYLLSLFSTALAFNISLTFIQLKADYNTVYCYGARGVRETAEFVRTHTDVSDRIFAPLEIIWLANEDLSSYLFGPDLWDQDIFLQAIKEDDTQCVVYGITGNTVEQYRRIFHTGEVQQFLKDNYMRRDIGSYTVWYK